MQVLATKLPEVLILEPHVWADDRGCFFESYNRKSFAAATGLDIEFVQDNHSQSARGVLRGLHYQLHHAQGKLVRVVSGAVFDVAVDLRRSSPRYGQWIGLELNAQTHRQLWIPPGFAHGFLVLSESAEVLYKATDFYDPTSERCIVWNDLDLGIAWPPLSSGSLPRLSAKDAAGRRFRAAETYA